MPIPSYISIKGQTQGNISAGAFTAESVGNIYVQGHEDEMLVQEFKHNITVFLSIRRLNCRLVCYSDAFQSAARVNGAMSVIAGN